MSDTLDPVASPGSGEVVPHPRSHLRRAPIGADAKIVPGSSVLFGDDEWDLRDVDYHGARQPQYTTISFGGIAQPGLKLALKELAYHRLNTRLSSRVREIGVYTCVREQVRAQRFSRWLAENFRTADSLADISQSMVHAYRVHLEKSGSPATVWKYLEPIKMLETYGTFLTHPLRFKPYGGRLSADLVGWKPEKGENSTPVIEEEILAPVLNVAIRYLEEYSKDVERMLGEFFEHRPLSSEDTEGKIDRNSLPFLKWLAATDPGRRIGTTHPFDEAVVQEYLEYVDTLSVSETTSRAYRAIGSRLLRAWQSGRRDVLQQPGDGHRTRSARLRNFEWRAEVSACPTLGRPWRPPFGANVDAGDEYRSEVGHVLAACATVILYLSGMRPGELSMLDVDCLQVVRDADGREIRWKIIGTPVKARTKGRVKNIPPRPVEWLVPEVVARAVQLLQRILKPVRDFRGSRLLMLNLDALQPGRTDPNGFPASERTIRTLLDTFQGMIRDRFAASPWGELPADGRIIPAQFRRTLARHIARQPFGIIAGKLQYKHVSTIIFEGYAGSDDAGFRAEVAEESVMAGIDMLEEFEEDQAAGSIFGPGARSLMAKVAAAKEVARARANVDRTDIRAAEVAALRSIAVNLHTGALNLCAFDPSNPGKALCLSEAEREKAVAPRMNLCSPGKCPNSTIGSCHVGRWQQLLTDAEELRDAARTMPQRVSLDRQVAEYRSIIGAVG